MPLVNAGLSKYKKTKKKNVKANTHRETVESIIETHLDCWFLFDLLKYPYITGFISKIKPTSYIYTKLYQY